MGNEFTTLTHTNLSDLVLEAFMDAMAPIRAFSVNASPAPAERCDKVKFLWVPAQDAAGSFSDGTGYEMQDADASGLDITLDQHDYVSWALTDKELVDRPLLELERFAQQKAYQLAKKVFQNILSVVTYANYGTSALVHDYQIDADDLATIRGVVGALSWPEANRSILIPSDYVGSLLKDAAIQSAANLGSAEAIREGKVGRLMGFDIYETNLIPDNDGEDVHGLVTTPEGIAIAMRYHAPQDGHNYTEARAVTHPDTGITLGYRRWYNPDRAQSRVVMECLYGFRTGNTTALKPIRGAATIYS